VRPRLRRAWVPGPSTSSLAAGMRKRRYFFWALLVAATAVYADPGSTLLKQMGAELKSMRSLPTGTPTRVACPKDRSTLVGLPQQQVHSELADPDHIESDGSWSYFFTGPTPPGLRGGGFLQLTFGFNPKSRTVAHVSCHYAR